MTREWRPGDVVTGLLDGIEVVGIIRGGGRRMFYADSVTSDEVAIKHVRNLRPLAVIDPEDREQVQRILDSLVGMSFAAHACGSFTCLQAALREFANPKPPKPDEPTGWGAVVEDDTGAYWTLYAPEAGVWINYREGKRRWPDINAVRVLSEGVPQ